MKKQITFAINTLSLGCLVLLSLTNVAHADEDRDATPEERSKVSNALKEQGCIYFEDVDFEIRAKLYKAEDVVCNDGKKYDIYLNTDFKIVSKREDRD